MTLTAVIFVPADDRGEAALKCLQHVQVRDYHLEGIVVGRWEDVQRMREEGVVQVIVVADASHVPPDRVPRIEVAGERPPPPDTEGPPPASRRRPKAIG